MLNYSLRQLEVFAAVVERNSFSHAASDLLLAQSTVSAHIKGLEDALGVKLFVRDAKRRVILTEDGAKAYSHAKIIIRQCQILGDEVSALPATQEISLAASTDSFEYLLPELITDFRKLNPDCHFLIVNGDSSFVHEQLLHKGARLGFVGTALDRGNLKYRVLCRDRLIMITPNNEYYRALKERGVLGSELLSEPMIVRFETSGTKKEFNRYLEQHGFGNLRLNIVARTNQADVVKSSVVSGIGVSVISELAANKYAQRGDLLTFDLDREGAFRYIYLAYPKDLVLSRQERDFVAFAVRHVRENDPHSA